MGFGTAPYPMLRSPWVPPGGSSQNLPFDAVPGINTFGIDTSVGALPVPFWDPVPGTLDPSNARFPPWDVVRLAGQILPGLCAITGGRAKRFDVKRVKGVNFATITHQGADPAQIKIVERIWTPQQLAALQLIMPILEPLNQGTQVQNAATFAVDIYHPALALRRITSVLIQRISILRPTPGVHGEWEQEIELLEYVPTKPKQNVTETVASSATYVRNSSSQPSTTFSPANANVSLPSSSAAFVGPNGH